MVSEMQDGKEPLSIDSFFSFINKIFAIIEVGVSFESWNFYKERILYSYEESELEGELIPVDTFAQLTPGSRIFWIGYVRTDNRSVRIEVIFNIGRDGQTRIETTNARETKGERISKEEASDKRKTRRFWGLIERLAPIIIPLIGELLRRNL